MKKIANRKIIRTLYYRTMREKKWKNLIAILAIALTSVLFTALFTVGGSLVTTFQESTFRQVGTSAHGGYKFLAMEEYERIKAAGGYKEISCNIIAGFGASPQLNRMQTEVRFAEDAAAKWSYSYPEEGKMPEEINECAASSKVLEALGVPLKLGEKVPISIMTHDKEGNEKLLEEEFVLSGFWYSNDASHAESFWISKPWLEENIDLLQQNYNRRMAETGLYHADGTVQAQVNFDSAYDIEKQMEELTSRAGFDQDEVGISVNWGYATSSVDGVTLAIGIGILGIIILSGYLIIYNIFYINVTADTRYYGLLKTIGTTGRQLRRMVRGQALLLSAAGIPLGLLLGWLIGKELLPFLYAVLETGGVARVTMNPLVFIGSALFSLLVVYLSCIKPCRLASRISPIEAVRYVESTQYHKKEKKSARVSMGRMAMANMGRNRRKTVLVVASLSLSLILINGTYCLVKGFSFDQYVKTYLLKDMQLSHYSYLNLSAQEWDFQAVTPEVLEWLEEVPGVENVYTSKNSYGTATISKEMLKRYVEFFSSEEMSDRPWTADILEPVRDTGEVQATSYCIEEALFPYLEILEGNFDGEKFRQGGYVLLSNNTFSGWSLGSVGDVIKVKGSGTEEEPENGPEMELEVMAVVDFPYSLGTRSTPLGGAVLVFAEKDFEELYNIKGSLHACFDVEEGKEEQVAETINEWINSQHPELVLSTKASLRQEFSKETSMFSIIGGMLGFILAIIGVLNLANAMITGILSRKQEFAMMQAVGMTGRQLEQMLTMEGIWYGIWTLAIAATLGNVVSYGLIYMIGKNMAFFEWGFHILPLVISIPVLAVLSVALPVICYHALCKKSIIERLRLAEV